MDEEPVINILSGLLELPFIDIDEKFHAGAYIYNYSPLIRCSSDCYFHYSTTLGTCIFFVICKI